MALRIAKIDDVTGKVKATSASGTGALFTETFIDATNGQVNLPVTGLAASSIVDAYRNGQLLEEGATQDYTRNVGSNRLELVTALSGSARFRIRIWQ